MARLPEGRPHRGFLVPTRAAASRRNRSTAPTKPAAAEPTPVAQPVRRRCWRDRASRTRRRLRGTPSALGGTLALSAVVGSQSGLVAFGPLSCPRRHPGGGYRCSSPSRLPPPSGPTPAAAQSPEGAAGESGLVHQAGGFRLLAQSRAGWAACQAMVLRMRPWPVLNELG